MRDQPNTNQDPIMTYDKVIDHDGYVTGIKQVTTPGGSSIEIRVSGRRETVEQFAAQVKTLQLSLSPARADYDDVIKAHGTDVAVFRRRTWEEQRKKLREILHRPDLELPDDPEQFDPRQLDPGALQELKGRKSDPRYDRIIQIDPIGALQKGSVYRLTFQIDPFVPQGLRDIYAPVRDVAYAWGAVDTYDPFGGQNAGDADLYLWRGGELQDSSLSSGTHDEVGTDSGDGGWELWVKGYTDAYYDISGDWVIIAEDV